MILSSSKDHPVQLHNALAYDVGPVATYPLISEKEDCITPSSLRFFTDGTHFVAGSDRYLSIFDVSRNGEPAVEMHRTIPSRKAMKKVGGVGINGVISSLDISSEGLLAAGTFTRAVGIYSSEGRGECVSLFKLDERYAPDGRRLHGTGITKLGWSPCGRYLYVAERRSDLVLVYDIRVTGTLMVSPVPFSQGTREWVCPRACFILSDQNLLIAWHVCRQPSSAEQPTPISASTSTSSRSHKVKGTSTSTRAFP